VKFNLADLLREHAARRPVAPCLTFEDRTFDYAELDTRSSRVANALLDTGVAAGDRVAVVARNSPAFYELVFGCAKVGAVLVPLNWRLSAREVMGILEDARPRLVFAGTEQRMLMSEAAGRALAIVDIDLQYAAWRDAALDADPRHPAGDDDVLALLYTSGTTGLPKGVMITHRNLSFSVRMAREVWGFDEGSVNLVAMPLFHIGGLGYGMMALSQGGHTVLLQLAVPAPVLHAIARYAVTHAFFVPTVIHSLVSAPGVDDLPLKSLQRIIYGASPINESLLLRAIDVFDCGFNHAYGMTETSGTVVTLQPEDHDPGGPHAARLRSCGRAVPWVELRIVDPDSGGPVATGAVGEIWIRSGMNTPGYWNKPDETAAAICADGWLRTGDAASQDDEGFVYIQDRYKDMIVTGAENVFPAEVENVLSQHPAVAEIAVIGVPHERWGETVKAIVVARPGVDAVEAVEAELIGFARARLAHYKCPTSVTVVEALPKSASGKVLKRELRGIDWSARKRQ
jgi:acyl-CoA synthetase (AMP-forming)/AMP-acid ligase II